MSVGVQKCMFSKGKRLEIILKYSEKKKMPVGCGGPKTSCNYDPGKPLTPPPTEGVRVRKGTGGGVNGIPLIPLMRTSFISGT